MTQSQVASALSVKTTTVSTWERGASVPDIETLYNLCKILGVSLEATLKYLVIKCCVQLLKNTNIM